MGVVEISQWSSKTWLKCKCFTESSFVIIGTDRDRRTDAMLALLASS